MTNWKMITNQLGKLNTEGAFYASIVNSSLNALLVVMRQFIMIQDLFTQKTSKNPEELWDEFKLVYILDG